MCIYTLNVTLLEGATLRKAAPSMDFVSSLLNLLAGWTFLVKQTGHESGNICNISGSGEELTL